MYSAIERRVGTLVMQVINEAVFRQINFTPVDHNLNIYLNQVRLDVVGTSMDNLSGNLA